MSKGLSYTSLISSIVNMLFSLIIFIEAVSSLMFRLCTFADSNGTLIVASETVTAADIAVTAVSLAGFIYSFAVMLDKYADKPFCITKTVAYSAFWCIYCIFFSIKLFSGILYPVRLKWYSSLPLVNINLLQYDFFNTVLSYRIMLTVIVIAISVLLMLITELMKAKLGK